MQLREYLDMEGIKQTKVAERTGISLRTISRICCNGYKVDKHMARLIEIYTKGMVTAQEVCRENLTSGEAR